MLAVVSRWNNLLEEIAEQLRASKALLQLWQRYKDYFKQCAATVQQQEGRTNEFLKAATDKDIGDDEVATWIQDCKSTPLVVCTNARSSRISVGCVRAADDALYADCACRAKEHCRPV